MAEKWYGETLCSLADDQVRVEIGPQIVEIDCTPENLDNRVTHANYRVGGRDAYGRIIMRDQVSGQVDDSLGSVNAGEKMAVVDWRERLAPKVWKVYQQQDGRFQKVAEFEDKDAALNHARGLI